MGCCLPDVVGEWKYIIELKSNRTDASPKMATSATRSSRSARSARSEHSKRKQPPGVRDRLTETNYRQLLIEMASSTMSHARALRMQPARLFKLQPTQALKIGPSRALMMQPSRTLRMHPTQALKMKPTQALEIKPSRPLFRPTPVRNSCEEYFGRACN